MGSAPIADLSYRDYDGPLAPPTFRWWVIARNIVRMALSKRVLWWLLMISGGYYWIMLIVFFFVEQNAANSSRPFGAPGGMDPMTAFMSQIHWKDQFLHGWSISQMWLFFITLLIGAGAIANDNRANALLVYLSKPCSKRDYLFGKWVGIFLTLLLVSAIPTLLFYAYCGLSYSEYRFFSEDPWLIFRLVAMLVFGAAFYASLALGISSLCKQGRIAGAMLAAGYFLTNFFTQLMSGAFHASHFDRDASRTIGSLQPLIEKLFYGSFDGVQIGMGKAVLGTDGSLPFGQVMHGPDGPALVPAPSFWLVVPVLIGLSALSLWIAWKRIRPVEVVS